MEIKVKLTLPIIALAAIFFTACDDGDSTTPDAVACFDYSTNDKHTVGDEIVFTNCSENATTYAWDFGDGDISTEENPTHIFNEAGEFTVKLIAMNENSANTTQNVITINVEEITQNRWKNKDLWSDYCEIEEQQYPISGYSYLTFTSENRVIYELELIDTQYECEGEIEEIGTWYEEEGKYYLVDSEDGEICEVTVSEDGETLCIPEWDECYEKE